MCTLIHTPRYIDKETIKAFKVFLFAPKSRDRFEGLYRKPNGETSGRFSDEQLDNNKKMYYRAGKVYRSGLPGFQAFLKLESARAWAQAHDGEVIVPVLMRLVIGTGSNPYCNDNTCYGGDNGIVVGLEMEISEAELIQPLTKPPCARCGHAYADHAPDVNYPNSERCFHRAATGEGCTPKYGDRCKTICQP